MQQKIKAVLVGCGGMASAWLGAARQIPDLEIVGFVDIFEAAAQKRAAEWGVGEPIIETTIETAIEKVHPDVVFDCTIPEAHAGVTTTALQAGCHVLGEKPLAVSMEEARRVVEVARQSGKIYAVIQNRRYDARIRRLKAFLDSGAIGDLTTLNCDFYLGAHFGGFRDKMEHVLLLDMAIHTFDAARFLSGADPVAVYCHEWNPQGSWYDHDASAIAIFEMSNGVVYTYRGSWCAEGLSTTWESDWRLIGAQGSAKWDGADGFAAQVAKHQGGFTSELTDVPWPPHDAGEKVGAHAGLMREFIHCVRNGGTPETICWDNIKSLAMVFSAIESSQTRRRVEITL